MNALVDKFKQFSFKLNKIEGNKSNGPKHLMSMLIELIKRNLEENSNNCL